MNEPPKGHRFHGEPLLDRAQVLRDEHDAITRAMGGVSRLVMDVSRAFGPVSTVDGQAWGYQGDDR